MSGSVSTEQRALTLMYHDVVPAGGWASSGFSGAGADLYKLELGRFREHLAAIERAAPGRVAGTVEDPAAWVPAGKQPRSGLPVFLSFDDGGESAFTLIAGELEKRGWRGHFFITTSLIGTHGFLTAEQIRALRGRGHVIGSHSVSHPQRISHMPWKDLYREWAVSVRVLSNILNERVTVASVPGGFYSERVAQAAIEAGIRMLFNSEPTTRLRLVGHCTVLGRYFVQRDTPAAIAGAYAAGEWAPRMKQAALWRAKRIAKAAGGQTWFRFRQWAIANHGQQPAPEQTRAERSRAA
ncbi:MAG TPA: polysaccharide deacetylase family protein [Bryobacteraceae bacterium]|nr:polysaccharide deacetylase family protein [Bryobacteraceae bacterium]